MSARLQIFRGSISKAQFDQGLVGAFLGAPRQPLAILPFPDVGTARSVALVLAKALFPPPLFSAIVDDGVTDDTAVVVF